MQEHSHFNFALRGALSGALICAACAVGVAFIGLPLIGLVAIVATTPLEGLGQGLMNSLTFAFVAIPIAAAISVLPSAIVGAVGGAVVGVLVSVGLGSLTAGRATLVGAGVGSVIVALLAATLLQPLGAGVAALPAQAQATVIGVPAVVLVGGMALVGRRLVKAEKGRSA